MHDANEFPLARLLIMTSTFLNADCEVMSRLLPQYGRSIRLQHDIAWSAERAAHSLLYCHYGKLDPIEVCRVIRVSEYHLFI